MITKKTVLVLGAGASADYGFPTGEGLIEEICDNIYPNSEWINTLPQVGIQPEFALQFRDALSEVISPSVDEFLLIAGHGKFAKVAKAASALALMRYEKRETLGARDRLYTTIYRRMEVRPERFVESASNLRFITFNYDRSLEYFFWDRCLAIADRNRKVAMNLFTQIRVIHVYGMLGEPDFLCEDPESRRLYAYSKDISNLKACINNMLMITDDSEDHRLTSPVRNPIGMADVLCFLGFGYSADNLKRLHMLPEWLKTKQFFGTAFDCSPNRRDEIEHMYDWDVTLGASEMKSVEFLKSIPIL